MVTKGKASAKSNGHQQPKQRQQIRGKKHKTDPREKKDVKTTAWNTQSIGYAAVVIFLGMLSRQW